MLERSPDPNGRAGKGGASAGRGVGVVVAAAGAGGTVSGRIVEGGDTSETVAAAGRATSASGVGETAVDGIDESNVSSGIVVFASAENAMNSPLSSDTTTCPSSASSPRTRTISSSLPLAPPGTETRTVTIPVRPRYSTRARSPDRDTIRPTRRTSQKLGKSDTWASGVGGACYRNRSLGATSS